MDNLLDLIFKATSVEPRYDEDLCLAAGKSVACTSCRDACPHDAITIRHGSAKAVEIDSVDCSGCGLCVQACPSQALEGRVSIERGAASLRCSQVSGSAASVHCLGRLQPSDLLRLAGSEDSVRLARGDCGSCPVGTAAVAEASLAVRDQAVELARLHGRSLDIEVVERDRLEQTRNADAVSRRELLRGGWRSLRVRTGDMLAPLDPGDDVASLPAEMQRRYRVIAAAAPQQEDPVPWSLPRVSDECIMCPACVKACPTGALERVFEADGDGVLKLQPDRCVGCEACMSVCPVGAVSMEESVSWSELSGGQQEAYRRDAGRERPGSVPR
ncbi:MAG: 4Fe-4S dicluster domain-containing protein [Trueperaceae bacterium]